MESTALNFLTEKINLTKGQRTAKTILEAAARCISKIGIEKTSVTNIAKEADLKRSLVAYHFPKKDTIVPMVFELIAIELNNYLDEQCDDKTGREALENIYKSYLKFYEEKPHYFHVGLHFFYLASINEKAKKLNTKFGHISVKRIKKALKELILDKNLSASETLLDKTAWSIQMFLVGSIMHQNCLDMPNSKSFSESFKVVLDEQIQRFLRDLSSPKNLN